MSASLDTAVRAEAAAHAEVSPRVAAAWRALEMVEDPEIPAVTVVDLGLVRSVSVDAEGVLRVRLSPTYVGCPATEVIRFLTEDALRAAAVGPFGVEHVLSPAWTSDWITSEGRRKLALNGIVPPDRTAASLREVVRASRPLACPRCGSTHTETVSEFGSTPCKALHRCRSCLEPFEYFKCI
ncbi:MAG TPA: 1,2-phenylacetyl-CoA epoxidase subunit PaaD [Steroidobacteraceae bacterium]|nr:1,2-phenylacetyl-CoA epoxidase subunit PaaD [Steroidobacteraceae bacterium]